MVFSIFKVSYNWLPCPAKLSARMSLSDSGLPRQETLFARMGCQAPALLWLKSRAEEGMERKPSDRVHETDSNAQVSLR